MAFRLVLPIFRKSKRLQDLTIKALGSFTEVEPLGMRVKRSDSDYFLARYGLFLKHLARARDSKSSPSITFRVAIVTALFGDEELEMSQYLNRSDCDYFYISDSDRNIGPDWLRLPVEIPLEWSRTNRHMARWTKLSLLDFLPDFDFIIWLDSNIAVVHDFGGLLEEFAASSNDIALFPHAERSSIAQEVDAIVKLGKADPKQVQSQTASYDSDLLHAATLWETPVMFIRATKKSALLFRIWRHEVKVKTLRDQLSLPYAIRNSGAKVSHLGTGQENIRSNPWFLSIPHKMDTFPARAYRYFDLEMKEPHQKPIIPKVGISVIIPIHNAIHKLELLLASLKSETHLDADDEIILVDDFSNDSSRMQILELAESDGRIRLLQNHENLGFAKSVNRGMLESRYECCVVLNSDVILPGNLFENLKVAWANHSPDILGFLSNNAGYQSLVDPANSNSWRFFGERAIGSTSEQLQRMFGYGHVITWPQIHGSLSVFNRTFFNNLGGLDESNFSQGYGEEVDFNLRAREAEGRILLCFSAAYYHFGSASFSSEVRLLRINQSKSTLAKIHGSHLGELVNELKSRNEVKRLWPIFEI